MRKSFYNTITIFAIIAFVIIIGFFLLDIEKTALNYWALTFLLGSCLISLIATLYIVSKKVDTEEVFINASLTVVTIIYEILVIVSIIFSKLFEKYLGRFILLEITIVASYIILAIIVVSFSNRISRLNNKDIKNQENEVYSGPKRGDF